MWPRFTHSHLPSLSQSHWQHTRARYTCTIYARWSRARAPSVFPPIPLSSSSSRCFFAVCLPLPFSSLDSSLQVLQYVSTLLQTQRRQREREARRFSRGLHGLGRLKRTRASDCTEKTRELYTQGCLGSATTTARSLSLSLPLSFSFFSLFFVLHRTVPSLPFRQTPDSTCACL